MAGTEKSTLQSILENLRDAGVEFGHRFQPPANVPDAVKHLLADLGIADPGAPVITALADVANDWRTLANQLSGISLDFLNPAAVLAQLGARADTIKRSIDDIVNAPNRVWNGMGAVGAAIKDKFPRRLLDYIVYEFITRAHAKIGGVFLLLGILRREFTPAPSAVFIDAEIRVFDLAQLIRVITHPLEAFLNALHWGTNEFNARPAVDGMVLLLSLLSPTAGPEDDVFPLSEESTFVAVDAGVRPSARRTLTVQGTTVSLVGLHKHGIGLEVHNPVSLSGGLGSLNLPSLPAAKIFALTPGPTPASDPPGVKILPP